MCRLSIFMLFWLRVNAIGSVTIYILKILATYLNEYFSTRPSGWLGNRSAIALKHNGWLGTTLALVFIGTIAWVSNARSRAQAAIYIIALLSPMCVFAIERANADIIMFLFMVAACVALQYGIVCRLFAYSVLVLASLLKFYPIAALGLALYEKILILTIVVVAIAAFWTIFLLSELPQLQELSHMLFQPISPYGDVFGGANAFFDLQTRLCAAHARASGDNREGTLCTGDTDLDSGGDHCVSHFW